MFQEIHDSLRTLYVADPRPWLIGFSGGKDSTMVASLIFEVVAGIPAEQRTKPISVVCTETRVEPERSGDSPPHLHSDFSGQIPAISDMVTGTLDQMRRFAESHSGEARPTDVVQQLYGIFPWVSFRIE